MWISFNNFLIYGTFMELVGLNWASGHSISWT